jgi:hypothetical protein
MDYEEREAKRLAAIRKWQEARADETALLVGIVKAYASEHYDAGGWDVIVECWDDAQLADAIGYASTPAGAIDKLRPVVSVWADQQADAKNSAF